MIKLHTFALLLAVTAVLADPLGQRDSADWQLVADGAGNLNLLDLNSEAEQPADSITPLFNPFNDIQILLFTRRNPQQGQRIQLNSPTQLRNSNFNAAHPTRFLIHGWRQNIQANINNEVRHAYLGRGEFNVFVVDWGLGANAIYATARNRVGDVGRHVAQFIDFLTDASGISFASLVVIGHSLGAHVAGFAGKRVTRGRIHTLIALDPAMPLFDFDNAGARVHHSDASYVESIQTDIGRLGFDRPIGHAAFYPSFGYNQPGCGVDLTGICSHERAVEFFAESVRNPRAFYGTRCAGWESIRSKSCPSTGQSQPMGGEPVARGKSGVFFKTVNAQRPFGQGVR